jgi:hypothetical protein
MNFNVIQSFLEKSAESKDVKVKKAASSLLDQLVNAEETEEIEQPALHAQEQNQPLTNRTKDEVDQKIDKWMPDIAKPEPDKSEFGKVASAYVADITVNSLPKDTQADVLKFAPGADKDTKLVLYGMTTSELLPKVDIHNYESAKSHIKKEMTKLGKKALADKFQAKNNNKYILLLNDSILDGHHHLAMADILGISCSLKVLDLTPARFQIVKKSSLFELYSNH